MWAQVSYSNNNPNIIAQYYLETIESVGGMQFYNYYSSRTNLLLSWSGCPLVVRADRETENSIVAFLQPTLRHADIDSFAGEKGFQYLANQVLQLC